MLITYFWLIDFEFKKHKDRRSRLTLKECNGVGDECVDYKVH
jgi:hypothetical protein